MSRFIVEAGLHPTAQVDAVFADGQLRPLRLGVQGGYRHPERAPLHGIPLIKVYDINGDATMEPTEGYESQSSYSPRQEEYIGAAKHRLSNLARSGKNIDKDRQVEGYQGLHHAIAEAFKAQEGPKDFERALVEATIGLFTLFAQEHENLQGVIEGLFKVSGSQGTTDSILMSAGFLEEAKAGRLTKQTLPQYAYIDQRLGSQARRDFEGFCPALDTGMIIKASAAHAALILSQTTDLTGYNYVGDDSIPHRQDLIVSIKERVLGLRSTRR